MIHKTTYLKLLAFVVIVITCFTTCKKYPEDKFFSLRTVKQRLKGEWQITKIEINGNDATALYNDSLPQSIDSYRLWYLYTYIEDKNTVVKINKSSKLSDYASDVSDFYFSFYSRKKNQIVFAGPINHTNKDSISSKVFENLLTSYNCDIKKLYKEQMIHEINKHNRNYRIYYSKTSK